MALVVDNFLHSLCLAIASAAGLRYATKPRQLDRYALPADAADPATSLRPYTGQAAAWAESGTIAIQCLTRGTTSGACMNASQVIYELFFESDGRPKRNWTINGMTVAGGGDGHWVILSADCLQAPGNMGVDPTDGKASASFNVEIRVKKTS